MAYEWHMFLAYETFTRSLFIDVFLKAAISRCNHRPDEHIIFATGAEFASNILTSSLCAFAHSLHSTHQIEFNIYVYIIVNHNLTRSSLAPIKNREKDEPYTDTHSHCHQKYIYAEL